MKILTIVTTIFLPLSPVAGWYGMNFINMPELTWKYGYPAVIGISVLVVLICLWIMKKKSFGDTGPGVLRLLPGCAHISAKNCKKVFFREKRLFCDSFHVLLTFASVSITIIVQNRTKRKEMCGWIRNFG